MARLSLGRDFFVPKGSRKVCDKRSDAVAYLYEVPARQRVGAMVFFGQQAKPIWHYTFKDAAAREAAIRRAFEGRQAHDSAKAETKAKRNQPHKLEVGHVLVSTWGYEQTNVDFYQVTRVVSPTMVEVRAIGYTVTREDGWMCGKAVPLLDKFTGEPTRHRVTWGDHVKVGHHHARIWEGRPVSWSAYH